MPNYFHTKATVEKDAETRGRGDAELCFSLILFLLLIAFSGAVRAEDVSVSAALSSAVTSVGEPVELQITVRGTQNVSPPEVRVDGLAVRCVDASKQASTQINFNNAGLNSNIISSIVFTYSVLPQKAGTFTIPAIVFDAGGKMISTQPLTLTVSGQATGAQSSQSAGTAANTDPNVPSSAGDLAMAEWVIPKTTAYVGEAIPVELRLYVLSKIRWDMHQMPSISGEGFTTQKIPKPTESIITKNGREYRLVIFKTAVIPAKTGKLTLPATELNTVMSLPQKRQQRQRQRMPGFPPGFADPFDDPFFDNFFGNPATPVVIKPDPVEVEIKPLPVAGRPANFSGAIGQFTLESDASPKDVHAGDPVTISMLIRGIGNFDRMNAPAIAEESGWRYYPPSAKFQPDDEVGISGAKTFEIAAIPEAVKTELPKIEFSYFNPSTEKYETLTGKRIALTVQGAPVAKTTPGPVTSATPAAAAGATPAPTPALNDIEYIRVDSGKWGLGFEPVWKTRGFWLAQLLPFAALLALGGWQWRRARLNDGIARRAARLRQEKSELLSKMQQEKTSVTDFYDAAIRVLQIETSLGRLSAEMEPETVDVETACASRQLDCETMEGVRHIFAAHDQLRYAGVGGGGGSGESIYPDQREQVLRVISRFEKSHA